MVLRRELHLTRHRRESSLLNPRLYVLRGVLHARLVVDTHPLTRIASRMLTRLAAKPRLYGTYHRIRLGAHTAMYDIQAPVPRWNAVCSTKAPTSSEHTIRSELNLLALLRALSRQSATNARQRCFSTDPQPGVAMVNHSCNLR